MPYSESCFLAKCFHCSFVRLWCLITLFVTVSQREWARFSEFGAEFVENFPLTQQCECYASSFTFCLNPGRSKSTSSHNCQLSVCHTIQTWWAAMVLEYHRTQPTATRELPWIWFLCKNCEIPTCPVMCRRYIGSGTVRVLHLFLRLFSYLVSNHMSSCVFIIFVITRVLKDIFITVSILFRL